MVMLASERKCEELSAHRTKYHTEKSVMPHVNLVGATSRIPYLLVLA